VGRACSTYWEKRNAYRVFVRNPEGNKPLGRLFESMCEDNNKMDLREIGWGGMD
jgi:hypothetical protein